MRLASALLVVILCLDACSSQSLRTHNVLVMRLKNRGPVVLSSENPYLAANLLLSKEMEKSPEMQGFIEHRGGPAALEVEQHSFSPMTFSFYYPEAREYFTLEETEDTWLIRGPFSIPADKQKEIAQLSRGEPGNPKLRMPASVKPTPQAQPSAQSTPLPEATLSSGPAARLEKAERNLAPQPTPQISTTKTVKTLLAIEDQETADQKALRALAQQSGEHPAEITARGDLVHYVTFPGETLSILARWYTFDRANAGRIARTNKLNDPNRLSIGDTVVVPSYLVKNKNRLTEKALESLSAVASKERSSSH